MGIRSSTILQVTVLLILMTAGTLHGQMADGGFKAEAENFILPQYQDGGSGLQFILYGSKAFNKGATVILDEVCMDLPKNKVKSLEDIKVITSGEQRPKAYKLDEKQAKIDEFWKNELHSHSNAWIFTNKAIYDKVTRIMRSDEEAFFRSRELDANGKGVDAYQDRKLIHIRAEVVVYVRANIWNTEINKDLQKSVADRKKTSNKESGHKK